MFIMHSFDVQKTREVYLVMFRQSKGKDEWMFYDVCQTRAGAVDRINKLLKKEKGKWEYCVRSWVMAQ